jgi:phage terminase large subunit-like protein
MTTLARILAAMPEPKRREALASLPAEDLAGLEFCWPVWARPDQLPPPGNWRTWLLMGGRGSGKTRAAAEWVRDQVETGRRVQVGIVGPTSDAVRRIQIEGPSGLLAVCPPWNRPQYEPSTRRVVWESGAVCHLFSAEEPDRLRGPNLDAAWADEITSWANGRACWDMLQMCLRIPGPRGDAPQVLVSTTPKMQALLKAIIKAPTTVITRAKTSDNAANLDASTLAYLQEKYGGTTLGRQELDAELLEDLEGALWNRALIDRNRVPEAPAQLRRIVVAIDPAGGSSKTSDETGIIAAGIARDGHSYVLRDHSGRCSPNAWAARAYSLHNLLKADCIVAEQNFGGEMVQATLAASGSGARVKLVHASRGKAVRAEPIVSLYEQGRVHHVGQFPELEDQLCGWDPRESDNSPDRLDALVWALTELTAGPRSVPQFTPEMLAQLGPPVARSSVRAAALSAGKPVFF